MTIAEPAIPLENVQHLVLSDVSWEFYERLLAEIGDRPIRVTFDDGEIEIMSPLPKHEKWGWSIGRLIDIIALDRAIPVEGLGSTTFRRKDRGKGLEPDRCYYIKHAAAARELEEEFDATIHPPPDLAIEVDITRRSIERQPIYAALGVPELWRFDGKKLTVLHLTRGQKYTVATSSKSFPFLPMTEFERFVLRLSKEPQLKVLREFRDWVRAL